MADRKSNSEYHMLRDSATAERTQMSEQRFSVDFFPAASFPKRKKLLGRKVSSFPRLLQLKRFQTFKGSVYPVILGGGSWDSGASIGDRYSLCVPEFWLQAALWVAASKDRQLQNGGSGINHPVKLS